VRLQGDSQQGVLRTFDAVDDDEVRLATRGEPRQVFAVRAEDRPLRPGIGPGTSLVLPRDRRALLAVTDDEPLGALPLDRCVSLRSAPADVGQVPAVRREDEYSRLMIVGNPFLAVTHD